MVTNFRDLIEALDITDKDGDCVSDEWENPEGDDLESEISMISASSTSAMNASSISGVPSFLDSFKSKNLQSSVKKLMAKRFL